MEIRTYLSGVWVASAVCALSVSVVVLGPSRVYAQSPIQLFLTNEGAARQVDLTNSNLGQSALAIQRTCAALIPQPGARPANSSAEQLFLRCGELVNTAADFNGVGPTARSLGYADSNELLAAFQQVNGEEIQATTTMAANASNEQFSNIAARLGALRGGASTSITTAAAFGSDFMFGSGGGAAADDAGFGPWGWFIRGTYGTGERDASNPAGFTGEENGFDFDQYGLTVGIDRMSRGSVWGIAVSYSSYEVTMNSLNASNSQTQVVNGGKIEGDSINGAFYFDYSGDSNFYVSALSGFGAQSFDMARNFVYFAGPGATAANVVDQTRVLTAAPDGDSLAGSIALGWIVDRGGFVFDPHVGVSFDRITIDRFAEVDSGNQGPAGGVGAMQLAFSEQKIDSLRANIGIQMSNNINTSFGSVRPTFSADWYHEFEDDPRFILAKYALEDDLADMNVPGFSRGFRGCTSCFQLRSEAPDSDFFVLGLGLAASYRSGLQAFVMVEGLLGYQNLNAYAVTLGVRGQF